MAMSKPQRVLIIGLSLVIVLLFQGIMLNKVRSTYSFQKGEEQKSIEEMKSAVQTAKEVKKSVDSMRQIMDKQGNIISTIQRKVDKNDAQLKSNIMNFKRERAEIQQKLNALENYEIDYKVE